MIIVIIVNNLQVPVKFTVNALAAIFQSFTVKYTAFFTVYMQ